MVKNLKVTKSYTSTSTEEPLPKNHTTNNEQSDKTPPSLIPKPLDIDPKIAEWMNSLTEHPIQNSNVPPIAAPKNRLIFALVISPNKISVEVVSITIKKNGEISNNSKPISLKSILDNPYIRNQNEITQEDWDIIIALSTNAPIFYYTAIELDFPTSGELLKKLIATNRCYIKNQYKTPLRWSDPKTGSFQWNLIIEKNAQKLVFVMDDSEEKLLDLDPFCYYNSINNTIGLIYFQEEQNIAKKLLKSPIIPNSQVQSIHKMLSINNPNLAKCIPLQIKETIIKCDPQPILLLAVNDFITEDYYLDDWNFRDFKKNYDEETETRIVANILFKYGDHTLQFNDRQKGPWKEVINKKNNEFVKIFRNLELENKLYHMIYDLSWDECEDVSLNQETYEYIYESDDDDILSQAIDILEIDVPLLKSKGFIIEFDKSFPATSVCKADEWFLDAGEDDVNVKNDWFDVKVGVIIDGEKVNLLPALAKLLKTNQLQDTPSTPEDEQELISLATDDGKLIQVSKNRLRKFADHLMLDFANGKSDGKSLRISKWNTGFLSEFTQGEAAAKNRWFGSDALKIFSESLTESSISDEVIHPKGLMCELRPYQNQGLNWMQFLRKFGLNGILADDMGLGKTVQTLAHILVEKEQGRATQPTLVIAPTTLMPNWFNEAARLAPSLKVLVLHGNERKLLFSKITEYDLVLTTYPLLMRDKEFLISHQFHMLILDEAQIVKNYKTQAYQVIQQIKTNHRICLSGTPMENHLGELWSLFHLLLPGFLGDIKTFQNIYQKPIEKQQNVARRDSLTKRIKPFILRRTKQQVALELPEKTEIVRKIELKSKQRDFYEAIRLRAQNKVMTEIQKKGLNASQIVVLDALLKLRQVCCDPRLVKMEGKESINESAKLEFLIEMLNQMVEEKRKILIFSQFTSMLELISIALNENNIPYTILTGETKDRNAPVVEFQTGPIQVMLISLKAGGVGLNLTAADTVIHYDPWWNPAVENQATDRAHRIGQKNAVFVYKLIVSGSLEEKIMEMQERKKGLMAALLDGNAKLDAKLSMEDLQDIFKPLPAPI
ncbi:MAG: DEAD/DEAH box helicase [Parachlamydiaceae bacterium]|nr:DEAD/DEAH box helicase [Parachlamydiaceae bacterium]